MVVLGEPSVGVGGRAEELQRCGRLAHGPHEDEDGRGRCRGGPAVGEELVKEIGVEDEPEDEPHAGGAEGCEDDGHGEACREVMTGCCDDAADGREGGNSDCRDDDQCRQLAVEEVMLADQGDEAEEKHAEHPHRRDPPHGDGEQRPSLAGPRRVAHRQRHERHQRHERDAPRRHQTQFGHVPDDLCQRLPAVQQEVEDEDDGEDDIEGQVQHEPDRRQDLHSSELVWKMME